MMRITFVVPLLESSGGARIITRHAQWLSQRGHEVLIVSPSPRKPGIKERAKALLRLGNLPAAGDHSHYAQSQVPVRVAGHGPPLASQDVPDADVIIATFWTTAEWIWPLPASKGVKVHFIQGYEDFPGLPAHRVEAVWRLPIYKIAISQWLVDLGHERFGIESIPLVPNSIDHQFFTPAPRNKEQPATVGFLYSGASFKDIPTTLAALQLLRQSKAHTNFISFGAVPPRRGELPSYVEFHHLPSQEEIARIYRRCRAWLSTSPMEGFNLPPLEAMATGCPAVCAKTGRPLEIIESGVNGHLVDARDARGFADALSNILSLSNPAWTRMSDAAIRAVAHPTWPESSALFEEALLRAVDDSW